MLQLQILNNAIETWQSQINKFFFFFFFWDWGPWPRTRPPSHVPHASHLSGRLGHRVPGPGQAATPARRWGLQEGSGPEWAPGGGPRSPGGIGIDGFSK